jgi:hypothetical protein
VLLARSRRTGTREFREPENIAAFHKRPGEAGKGPQLARVAEPDPGDPSEFGESPVRFAVSNRVLDRSEQLLGNVVAVVAHGLGVSGGV